MLGNTNCPCNCRPCVCSTPAGVGCLPDLCVPRPCFFDGQLIGSEDLNALIRYSRSRDLSFGRFVAGWGIYGGFTVEAAPGIERLPLDGPDQPLPSPQILAGTTVTVSPGVAIDANGRQLVACAPEILDLAALAAQAPSAPQTKSCEGWFGHELKACDKSVNEITATRYWLIAEYDETPSRPVPQYSGGGPCDPAPTCDYSRRNERVRYSLVPSIPESYPFSGCLDGEVPVPIPTNGGDGGGDDGGGGDGGGGDGGGGDDDDLFLQAMMVADLAGSQLASQCCQRPAVVLAQVLFTSSPGSLAGQLQASLYTLLDNHYPARRVIPSSALNWQLTLLIAQSRSENSWERPVAAARIDSGGWVNGRGIDSASWDSLTCTVNFRDFIAISERVVQITPYTDDTLTVALTPSIHDGSDSSLKVRFYDASGNALAPVAFGITVHRLTPGS